MRTSPPSQDPDEDKAILGMVMIILLATFFVSKVLWGR